MFYKANWNPNLNYYKSVRVRYRILKHEFWLDSSQDTKVRIEKDNGRNFQSKLVPSFHEIVN